MFHLITLHVHSWVSGLKTEQLCNVKAVNMLLHKAFYFMLICQKILSYINFIILGCQRIHEITVRFKKKD